MIRINLIKVRTPRDRIVVQQQVLAIVGATVGALIFIGWWATNASAVLDETKAMLENEKAKLVRLEAVAKRIEEFEKKKQRREQILEAIKKLEAKKVGPRPFLDDLNVILPPDIWLDDMSQTGIAIKMTGYSFSNGAIAELMRLMEKSPNFSDIEVGEITNVQIKGEDVKKFSLNCKWKALQAIEEKIADKTTPAAATPAASTAAKH